MAELVQSECYYGLHWLSLTVTGMEPIEVLGGIEVLLQQKLEDAGGARFFEKRFVSVDKHTTVLTGHRGDGDESTISINFTGQACETLNWSSWRWLSKYIVSNGGAFKVTRLDFAVDGLPGGSHLFAESERLGGIEHGFHKARWMQDITYSRDASGMRVRSTDDTFYVGSPSSDRFIRVYDARRLEDTSGKVFDQPFSITRIELVFKNEYATSFFMMFLGDEYHNGVTPWLAAIDDMLRINWTVLSEWLQRVRDIFTVVMEFPKVVSPVRTVDNKIRWLFRSVSKTLAGVAEVYPDIGEMLQRRGKGQLSPGELAFYQAAGA